MENTASTPHGFISGTIIKSLYAANVHTGTELLSPPDVVVKGETNNLYNSYHSHHALDPCIRNLTAPGYHRHC